MRANEEEIPSVPDTAPKAVQKLQKAKNKPSVQKILKSVKPPSSTYRPIQVEDRPPKPTLPSGLVTPLDFFSLFITPVMFSMISEFTNFKAEDTKMPTKHTPWFPTTSADIQTFVGILISMGLTFLNHTESYWDTHSDMHGDPEISQAMSLTRWKQIKRFFKLSNPRTDPDPKSSDYAKNWTAKLEPFSTLFRKACEQYLHPGRNVSVDEQLILFKGRSKHTMNIPSKAAGRGFKIYCLCNGNYLCSFMYASKSTSIVDLKPIKDMISSASMIIQIVKRLAQSYEYVVYMNNFFTSVKLFSHLKELGIGAVRTSKQGSGFDVNLLKLKAVTTKEKNWGTKAITTVDQILCMAWQDNNTVLLMTTAHWPGEAQQDVPRNSRKRHHISEDFVQIDSENNQFLPFPRAIVDYNLHMGGVDGNAQQRSNNSLTKRCRRYYWSLFTFILEAALLNAFILYQLVHSDSKMKYARFQKEVAVALLRNPAGSTRKRPHDFSNSNSSISPSEQEHHWIQLTKPAYCTPCKAIKNFTSGAGKGVKRKAMAEVDGNGQPKKQRKRTVQTKYECSSEQCTGLAACKNEACWEALHA